MQLQQQHLIAVGKKVQLQQQNHIAAEKKGAAAAIAPLLQNFEGHVETRDALQLHYSIIAPESLTFISQT